VIAKLRFDLRAPAFYWTALATALAAVDLSQHLFVGWVPHDEGTLGLAARLVRAGGWPHRDFSDVYSGGLAVLDALAQGLWGDRLSSLRIPFGLAALAWVPLLAACFRRFVPAGPAAGLALLGFLWGPPNYTAAMPTWYLLFLATAVVWALFRWQETGDIRWWGVAGVIIGAALLLKINALFLLAAAGIYLLSEDGPTGGDPSRVHPARFAALALPVLGAVAAIAVISPRWGWLRGAALSVPLLVVVLAVVHRRWRDGGTGMPSLRALRALAIGVMIPIIPVALAYGSAGALADLARGIFILPFLRQDHAWSYPPTIDRVALLAAIAYVALVIGKWTRRTTMLAAAVLLIGAGWAIIEARTNDWIVIQDVWRALRFIAPLGLILGAAMLHRADPGAERRTRLVLLTAAWFALVQYPYAAPMYFVYAFPLYLLAAVALFRIREVPALFGGALAVALAAWIVGTGHGQVPRTYALQYHRDPPMTELGGPHGGIRVPVAQAETYGAVLELLDDWKVVRMVAGPDTPELYYLAGRPSPDRELFEFTAPGWSAELFARRIRATDPEVVILNSNSRLSRVDLDSVLALLPGPWAIDTTIGHFRLLRSATSDARP
jgi:hypothetical protein